jgi:hypothetical protein
MSDLWSRSGADCGLVDGEVYHYWFEVTDSRPGGAGARLRRTDPAATTVDWRLLSPPLPPPYGEDDRWPAAVVMWRGGELVTCDPDGGVADWSQDPPIASLPGNNRTVYYKLPTRWARRSVEGGTEVGVGTFRDVLALVDPDATAVTFRGVAALAAGRAYLRELGISALELSRGQSNGVLPISHSRSSNAWAVTLLGRPRSIS